MRCFGGFIASYSLFLPKKERCTAKKQFTFTVKSTDSTLADVPISTKETKYRTMLDWLRDDDNAYISNKLKLMPSTLGGGFGAFVTESVEENELLFRIPRGLCITLSDAFSDPQFGESFQKLVEKAGPGGNTVVLAGYIAKEKLKGYDDSLGSRYGPYLATLPWDRYVNNQEHILYWSDDEIESLLTGSMCYNEAVDLRKEVSFAKTVLETILSRPKRSFKLPWESEVEPIIPLDKLPEAVTGAFVCLLTRAFQDDFTDDANRDEEKLVPLLDMLQHSEEPNVSHVMLKEMNGDVEVRARRSLGTGEELLNQYRSEMEEGMPYHRFFTRFGFVPGIDEPILDLLHDKSTIFFAQKAEV